MEDQYLDSYMEDQMSGGWMPHDDLQEFSDNEAWEDARAEREEAYMYDDVYDDDEESYGEYDGTH